MQGGEQRPGIAPEQAPGVRVGGVHEAEIAQQCEEGRLAVRQHTVEAFRPAAQGGPVRRAQRL